MAHLIARPPFAFVAEFLDWAENFRAYRARKAARNATR